MITYCFKKLPFAAVLLVAGNLYAQDSVPDSIQEYRISANKASQKSWIFAIKAGLLSPVLPFGRDDFSTWKPQLGYSASISKQIIQGLSLQADFLGGKLEGDKSKLTASRLTTGPYDSFKTTIGYSGSLSANLKLGNIYWKDRESMITPYISAGAGLLSYKISLTDLQGQESQFNAGNTSNEVFFPVGVGLKFSLSDKMNLGWGYTLNFVNSDYLDGYFNLPQNDKFSYLHLGLEYGLGKKPNKSAAPSKPLAVKKGITSRNASRNPKSTNLPPPSQIVKKLADTDKDGILDDVDTCPATPTGTQVDNKGCPVVTVVPVPERSVITEEDRNVIAVATNVLEFDFGKATIQSQSFPSLDAVAKLLIDNLDFSLKIDGHTDNVGSEVINLKLSQDRAQAVRTYLISKGADPLRLVAEGFGESQPVAGNDTEAGRQKNRRVEFTFF